MLRAVRGLGGPLTAEVEVGFVGAEGVEVRASLITSGLWWSSTTGRHVGYESWLERDHLMLLDFDPAVAGIASPPFWLFWDDARGRRRSHAPGYFARLVDGRGMVVDCRPAERIKPRDTAAFDATRRACELVGWEPACRRLEPATAQRPRDPNPRHSTATRPSFRTSPGRPPRPSAGRTEPGNDRLPSPVR